MWSYIFRKKYRYSAIYANKLAKRYVSFYLNKKRIYTKLFNCLMNLASQEKIPVYLVNKSIKEMNDHFNVSYECDDDMALGLFGYKALVLTNDDGSKDIIKFIKATHIVVNTKDRNIEDITYTLSHELGHYFSIKDTLDNSEEAANRYRLIFAKRFLTESEFKKIECAIRIYAGERFYYEKNKPENGCIFYDLRKEQNEIRNIKKKLYAHSFNHYKNILKNKSK